MSDRTRRLFGMAIHRKLTKSSGQFCLSQHAFFTMGILTVNHAPLIFTIPVLSPTRPKAIPLPRLLYIHPPKSYFTPFPFLLLLLPRFLSPRVRVFAKLCSYVLLSDSSMAQQEVQNGGAEKVAPAVSFTAVKPQILVEAPKANDAVQFYKAAFCAEEVGRTTHHKRKAEQELPLILSAELKLAGFTFLVSDLTADDTATPAKSAGSGVVLCLETEDVEAAINKAVAAGAVAEGEVVSGEGACGGERVGKVKDPFGFVWAICAPAKKGANPEVED